MISLTKSMKEQLASTFPLPDVQRGVLISQIVPNSPADHAGCLEGDIIVSVDKEPVSSTQEILRIIGLRVHEDIQLTVVRNLALEQDWDGRIMRYETETRQITVKTADLNTFLSL